MLVKKILVALVAFAMLAFAWDADAGVREPPVRFLGHVKMRVVLRYVANIRAVCGGPRRTVGCAKRSHGVCRIYIAYNTRSASIDDVRRHELAHCNGWHHR